MYDIYDNDFDRAFDEAVSEVDKAYRKGYEAAKAELVRCGECRKSVPQVDPDQRYCVVHARLIGANQFCSYGERPVEGESKDERVERFRREMEEARKERWGECD